MRRRKKNKEKLLKYAEKKSLFDISQETKNSIWGILSLILAVISIFSFFNKAGSAGEMMNATSRLLFGWGFFIIPIAFTLLGVSFIKSISRKIYFSAIIGTVLFILAFLGIFFVLGEGDFAVRVEQGGYLGAILGYPLLRFLGFTVSIIILPALLFISILLALNIPLYRLITTEEKDTKLTDNIVIKKNNETVSANGIKKPEEAQRPKLMIRPAKQNIPEKEFVIRSTRSGKWTLPPLELLNTDQDQVVAGDINANAMIIKRTLTNFGIEVEMGEVAVGPTVTQFTMRPAIGVKLSRIIVLNSDLSLALAAHPIRIEAPIPGKSLVGIEVPNKKASSVGLRNMLEHEEFQKSKYFLPIALGRNVSGAPVFAGLEKMPHLLIAGATGTGKSVAINSFLLSLLYKHSPDILKFILIDPKRVELSLYNGIPHLITPVITENKKVIGSLRWAVSEMDRRYDLLLRTSCKDIFSYNTKMAEKKEPFMPVLIIVIDELADLMASHGRDVEAAIVRLAQMSRAVGIHLVVSTQRPSVEVITGLIKANITSRIALQVASQIDSRTILDMASAEKLLGKGDMLFLAGDVTKPRRLQGPMITEREVKDVVKFLKNQAEKIELEDDDLHVDFNASGSFAGGTTGAGAGGDSNIDDDMYDEAKRVVVESQRASASLLQRRIRVGYARAARLLDMLEEHGIVGPGEGAKPRDVYVKQDGARVLQDDIGQTGVNADTMEAEREEA